MADKKISELTAITGANTAATDAFVMVDTSTGETKKITREELNNAIEQDVLSTVDINGGTIDGTTIGGTTAAAGSFTTVDATGNITVAGTVDGRDVAADGTKLDGIEASATADQTGAEIATALNGETISSLTALTTTGAVIVGGDLTVNGTTTTINSTTLTVDDKNIELASGAADAAAANGAGITIDGASATFNYASTGDKWTFNKPIDVTGNIIVSGTVDGRDVAADGTKLDGIEASATADQTAAEIRTLVESATDSNVFTDADHTKLNGIETGATADQTKSDIDALGIDAATLDSIDSTSFLRSDANDTATGDITFQGFVTITGSTGYPVLHIKPASAGNTARIRMGLAADDDHGQITYDNSSGEMTLRSDNVDTMTLNGSNVLIGTDSGDAFNASSSLRLQPSSGSNYIQIKTGTSDNAGLLFGDTDDDFVGGFIYSNSSNHMEFYSNNVERARLESDGDLHVDGNVVAYSTTISDIRLKKDIAPIEDAVSKVQQLNGCTFTYLKDDRKSAGLIAQDVEKALPSAVIDDEAVFHGEEGETYKTVQYDQVIGLLVEAIKELKDEIEELKNASAE